MGAGALMPTPRRDTDSGQNSASYRCPDDKSLPACPGR